MGSKLEIFFGRFAIYIAGIFLATSIACGIGWALTSARLGAQIANNKTVQTQLEVSNASYVSIRDQFKLLTNQLEANQEKALTSHAYIQEQLKSVVAADRSLETLEGYLKTRQPTTDCKVPKDLADAWSKM